MPKRSRNNPPTDLNELARSIVDRATGATPPKTATPEPEPEPAEAPDDDEAARKAAARLLGSRGGKKGGKARAAALTPEERAEIARKAAQARWSGVIRRRSRHG